MNTHPDFDAPRTTTSKPFATDALDELQRRVVEMTEKSQNQITAGKPGESALSEKVVDGMFVRQMLEDPACIRISLGDPTPALAGQGVAAYCVFRGDRDRVIALLERALLAMKS